jgi:hypothetical protein
MQTSDVIKLLPGPASVEKKMIQQAFVDAEFPQQNRITMNKLGGR